MQKSQKPKVINSKLGSFVRFLYYLLFFAVPLIMYSGTSELFEFNKMLFIYSISVLVGFLWLSEIILYGKKIIFKAMYIVPLLLFLVSQILSTVFSIDVHTSLFGYYGRFNGGLFSIIAYMLLFYVFIQYFNLKNLERLFKVSLVSSTIVIAWGFPGKFGYDLSCKLFTGQLNNSCWTDQFRPSERMFSTLGQPNWLGAYLAINLFLGLYFLLKNKKDMFSWSNIIVSSYLVLNFAAILFTRSRSALGAVGISFVILPILLLLIKQEKKWKLFDLKIYTTFLILMSVSVVFFGTGISRIDNAIDKLFLKSPTNITTQKSIDTVSDELKSTSAAKIQAPTNVTDSFDIRKIVWRGAIDLGNKYPLFGTGVETFAYAYYFARPVEHNLTSEWDFLYNKAHNEFLNYFATTGYFGLVTYTLMIISVFYVGLLNIFQSKRNSLLITCILASYITILVTNFFGFSTTTVNIFFYLILGFIIISLEDENESVLTATRVTLRRKFLMVIPLLLSCYTLLFIFQYFLADVQYSIADQQARNGNYQKSAETYNSLLQMHYEHVYEDKLSNVLANLAYVAAYQKEKKTSDNLLKLSEYYNQKAIYASSANINYWKTTVKNDYLFYQIELNTEYIKSGIESLKRARLISPTDPKLPYSEALFYSLLEDEEKDQLMKQEYQNLSIQSINDAIRLKSNYRDSYFLKGQLLKKYGNKIEANKAFQFILDHINPHDQEAELEIK